MTDPYFTPYRRRIITIGLIVFCLIASLACKKNVNTASPRDGVTPHQKNHPMNKKNKVAPASHTRWSQSNHGLEVGLELPEGLLLVGDTLYPKLWFRNSSDSPIRIYLIRNAVFRSQQSDLFLRDKASGKVVSAQPTPQPHGYEVTEEDFHLIAPKEERFFPQPLKLTADNIKQPGDMILEWRYSNKVEIWKGGAQTLDGPTKPLFNGEKIPHIWVGDMIVSEPKTISSTENPHTKRLEVTLTQKKPLELSNGVQLNLFNTLYAHMSGAVQNESMAIIDITHLGVTERASLVREHPRGDIVPYNRIPHLSIRLEHVDAYHQPATANVIIFSDDKNLHVDD